MSFAGQPGLSTSHGAALRTQKYRQLVRQHFDRLLGRLFINVTGLHFHIVWVPAPPHEWQSRTLPTTCSVCCRLRGLPLPPECRACGPRHLAFALKAERDGHQFTCRLGVRNFWLPIRVRGETVGIAYLQALDGSAVKHPGRKRSARLVPRRVRVEFAGAARFLRRIVSHAQTSSLADLQEEDLIKFQQALHVSEIVQTRLRKELHRALPALQKTSPVLQPQSRPERIVGAVLDRIQRDYARPLTLRKCADDLRVNAAYLSDLFSHAVGLPFKTCLTEARVEKARELLGDPTKNISQVAAAVGYASANRFRIAFEHANGLSPRKWRETLRMQPPPPH
ncbi:MAG: helix-turn-helix domain-containing protein [Limisphaerales bacterium]